MSDARIRLGIIGCGYAARELHAPRLRNNPNFDVVAVCDLDPAAATTLAATLDARMMDGWSALVDSAELDAIAVLTPVHGEIVRAALTRGHDVFVEKPMCEDPCSARELAELASRFDRVLEVGTMRRYDPALPLAQAALAELGALRWITLRDAVSVGGLSSEAKPAMEASLLSALPLGLEPIERHALQTALLQAVHDLALLRALFNAPLGLVHGSRAADGWSLSGELRVGDTPCLYGIAEYGLIHLPQAQAAFELQVTAERGTLAMRFADALDADTPTQVLVDGKLLPPCPGDVHRLQWAAFAQQVRERPGGATGALRAAEDIELLWQMAGVSPTSSHRESEGTTR